MLNEAHTHGEQHVVHKRCVAEGHPLARVHGDGRPREPGDGDS